MKVQSVFLFIFLITFVSKSTAGTVEVAQWIPWSFINTEIKKVPLSFQSTHPNLSLSFQEWNPKATNIDFQLSGKLTDLEISETGIQALAENLSARLTVGQLAIDQVITREISGNMINIRVQATCQPFQIQIPSFAMALNSEFLKEENYYSPKISQVRLQIPNESWIVSPIVCQGPQGLDRQIVALIQSTLSKPAVFQDLIKGWIAPHMNNLIRKSWTSLTSQAWENLKIQSMSPPTNEGLILNGQIDIAGTQTVPRPLQDHLQLSETLPQLILSTEAFKALAQENLSAFNFKKFNIQQISGFASLMKSRFLQLFVWPDLISFSRSAPFYLSTDPAKTKLNLISQGSGIWQMQLQTGGVLQVEKRGALHDYLHWGVGLSSQLATEVKDSRLILKTQNSKSQFNWGFDQKYIQLFNPNNWISKAVFNEAGKALFQDRTIEKQLPVLTWQNRSFKLNGWSQKGDSILMDWKE